MLMMVTSRRIQNGQYGDQEQSNYGFHYLGDYQEGLDRLIPVIALTRR